MYNRVGEKATGCNGNVECLEDCAKQLRECLDTAFPDSKKIEFESDKINYILSSIFFLANRLAKTSIGLAEFDRAAANIEKMGKMSLEDKENTKLYGRMEKQLNEIIAKYF